MGDRHDHGGVHQGGLRTATRAGAVPACQVPRGSGRGRGWRGWTFKATLVSLGRRRAKTSRRSTRFGELDVNDDEAVHRGPHRGHGPARRGPRGAPGARRWGGQTNGGDDARDRMVPAPRGTPLSCSLRGRPGSGGGVSASDVFGFESVMMMSQDLYVRRDISPFGITWHHSRARAQPCEMAARSVKSAPALSVHASTSKDAAPFSGASPHRSRSTRRALLRDASEVIISSDTF